MALLNCTFTRAQLHNAHFKLTVPKFETRPGIDGFLHEKCWEDAERLGHFTEFQPREGAKPEVGTEVLLGHDDTNLYVGFICYEGDVSRIRATAAKRDAFTENDDWIWIILDTYDTSTRGLILAVNPRSVQVDWYTDELAGTDDVAVDLDWDAVSNILDDRWTVEIAIPFKSLRFPPGPQQHWRVDFLRIRPRESEELHSWVPHAPDDLLFARLGHLHIDDRILTSRGADLLPYLTMGTQDGVADDHTITAKMGLGGKYWISSDFIFDWAIRPDYSQIESDEPQIDVNTTFALYYPEKRPLFLERKELFETPIPAIYTRAINDPIATFKLSSKATKTDLGYIAALDQRTPWVVPFAEQSLPVCSDRSSLSNILRVRYELGRDSHIALLATSRELEKSFNRVLGGDGRIRLLDNYCLTFQGLASWSKEPDDTILFPGYPWLAFGEYSSKFDGEEFTGKAFMAEVSRKGGRYVDFDLWSEGYSPEFRADNGFVNSNDFRKRGLRVKVKLRPNRFAVEQVIPQVTFEKTKGYEGGDRDHCTTSALSLVCKKQNYLSFQHTWGSKAFVDHRFHRIWTVQANWSSNTLGFLSPDIACRYGREINYFAVPPELGYMSCAALSCHLNPLPELGLTLSYGRYLLWDRSNESRVYDAKTLSNQVTYSFSRHLRLRLIGQYSSDTETIQLSPLLSFEPTPFTVIYLGANHSHEKRGSLFDAQETDRCIFLKLQYRWEI